LHRLARGIDERPVAPRGAAKQVSAETTFDTDLTAMTAVHDAVARMTEAAHRRLVASGRAARTVTVKVRSADFTTSSRSETAGVASTDLGALTAVAQRLARAAVPQGGVRLIGVSLAGLTDDPPPALFEPLAPVSAVAAPTPVESEPAQPEEEPVVERPWRQGDDVTHPGYGHGWVQGAGHGRVTVRFETRTTGPGRARTLKADDPDLTRADPLASLA
jgi:DNA polymerase-4